MLGAAGKGYIFCIKGDQRNLWTLWHTKSFVKKLQLVWPMSSLIISHLPLQHQNSIACVCFTRYAIGKARTCHQMNGVGSISTDAPPAPEELLKVIRSNCNTDCSSQRCSCKKHGMKCSLTCGNCKGSACQNAGLFEVSDEEDLND